CENERTMGAKKAIEVIQTQDAVERELLIETLREIAGELNAAHLDRERVEEAMQGLDGYMMGWHALEYGDEGPSLPQLHQASRMLRPLVQMSGHVRGGYQLLASYTWDGGIHHDLPPVVERPEGSRGPRKSA